MYQQACGQSFPAALHHTTTMGRRARLYSRRCVNRSDEPVPLVIVPVVPQQPTCLLLLFAVKASAYADRLAGCDIIIT